MEEEGALVVPAPVTVEVDYLLGKRLGQASRAAFLEDLAAGRFVVDCLSPEDHAQAAALDRRYGEFGLGLADLSVVVAAGRFETRRVATFDERHFRAVRPLQGGSFSVLPADEA